MKVGQFNYKQQTGLATIFTAETDEEVNALENLRILIENEEGVLSRKSFSFGDGTMSVDIDKKVVKQQRRTSLPTATPATRGKGKATGTKTDGTK